MLGFTPFDDEGTKGQDVVLFCGETLKTQLLTKVTGNLRAVSSAFHPIIRQRCFIVRTRHPTAMPFQKTRLHLEEIHQGSWNGDHLNLIISKAVYRDAQGKNWRLPEMTLKMSTELILKMNTFSDTEIFHPAGGCHKGLQRGLDVTFQTPSAWIALKGNKISTQELDFL